MTLEELIAELRKLDGCGDSEAAHGYADDLLLKYIADDRVTEAFNAIEKWYA